MALRYAYRQMRPYHSLLNTAVSMSRLFNTSESAYRSETGGLMEALRSLTVEQSKYKPCLNPATLFK